MSKLYSDERITVGKITSTHGLRGEVKVYPLLDDPDRFSDFTKVILDTGRKKIEQEIERVKFFKNMVIVKFKGIDDINDVMMYRGAEIRVFKEEAADLGEDQYFEVDLIGMTVYTDEDKVLGILDKIMHTGANDVYVVKMEDGKEVLIPAIKQCILDVDIEEGTMRVHLLGGML